MFLKDTQGWAELTDWRSDNGLNPLIIGDKIHKGSCPGKGAACTFEIEAGRAIIVPDPAAVATPTLPADSVPQVAPACPSSSTLDLQSPAASAALPLTIHPCDAIGRGGAVIEAGSGQLAMRMAEMQNGRAWTQPLYQKLPKQPKPRKPKQSREPAPAIDAQPQ